MTASARNATVTAPAQAPRDPALTADLLRRAFRTWSSRESSTTRRSSSRTRARFLPDQRRGPRGDPDAAGHAAAARRRLGVSLLPRPRPLPRARRHAVRDAPAGRRGQDDPASGGRQMPSHWGHTAFNIVSRRARRARSACRRWGCAEAAVFYGSTPRSSRAGRRVGDRLRLARRRHHEPGRVLGIAQHGLPASPPVVYLVEDNGYAISVPVEFQTPGGDVSRLVESFPG